MSDLSSKQLAPEVLTALRGSIAKWQAIVDGTGEDAGPENCPLCLMFNDHVAPNAGPACAGCPIKAKTELAWCEGTPYDGYYEAVEDDDDGRKAYHAKEELEFLVDLEKELSNG